MEMVMMMSSLWLFAISLLVISTSAAIMWIHRWRNPKCKGILPPGSMGLPLLGETLSLLVKSMSIDIHPFFKERMNRYGPVFKTSIAGRSVVVSTDPDFSDFVLKQEGKLVEIWYLDSFAKLLLQDATRASGYVHKYLRNNILNHFGVETLKNTLLSQIECTMNQRLEGWANQPEVQLKEQLAAIIFEFTAKHLIGYEPAKLEENLVRNLSNFFEGLMSFPLPIPGTAFYRCIKEEHEEILHKKRKYGNSGHGDGLVWADYKSMNYTHNVINETLRLASVAPGILRRAVKDIHFNGYTIPKGWAIMVVPAALQLNPNVFEDPLTFNPSRWENIGSNVTAKNFMAFGGGNRQCAGAEYSKVFMAVFLHVLVTKYRWTKIKGGDVIRAPTLTFSEDLHIRVSKKLE